MISARVWSFGDNINTDLIQPTPYMYLPAAQQHRHVFEANRPGWVDAMRPGDIIVAGENFGMGSSRPAPMVLRSLGLGALLADSINALFFRNCVSFGLPAFECPGVSRHFAEGDIGRIDEERFLVENLTRGGSLPCRPLPKDLLDLMRGGGIFPLLEAEGYIDPAPEGGGAAPAAG